MSMTICRPCACEGFCDKEDQMAPDMYCKAIQTWLSAQISVTTEKPRPCPHGKVWLVGGQICACTEGHTLAVTEVRDE